MTARIPRSVTRIFMLAAAILLLAGCTMIATQQLDNLYGTPQVVDRTVKTPSATEPEYYRDIKPIMDRRCVVCHGCYDAPCQLKLSSFEGIDRGASKDKVYNGGRLLQANLTRLSIDATATEEWRHKGFSPVLNEREQTPEANRQASVMHRLLKLKEAHPLPDQKLLPDSFDLSLNRDQQCSTIEEFARYEENYPLWGMPYGLPAIEQQKQETLENWLASGAKVRASGIAPTRHQTEIDQWEQFLNGDSLKQKLMSRYIYEHLFLANIYFGESVDGIDEEREFFKLVRSSTPPGQEIVVIPTRRPLDDPGSELYYRIQRGEITVLAKRHMPYRFNEQRLQRWTQLFLEPDYEVTELPSYDPEVATNPFVSFQALPVNSRYEFMLDEAEFTIMGFIKGPVCRGQVALNVINDHFWVLFVDPDAIAQHETAEFLAAQSGLLRLPAEKQSNALRPLSSWLTYSSLQKKYLEAKEQHIEKEFPTAGTLNMSELWDGDGHNRNAALTIFRHYDSATVIKGLVGDTPKTAWVIGYPLLERIHYLLVAGFDVYGNAGHQLLTRLYMDFLRMEGEYTFLQFLPNATAQKELDYWYRGAESNITTYLDFLHNHKTERSGIDFKTDNPKKELFELARARFGEKVIASDPINHRPALGVNSNYQKMLQKLSIIKGVPLNQMSEQSVLRLTLNNGDIKLISLLKNRAHSNVSHLLNEQARILPKEQTLTVVEYILGSYPNVFFDLQEDELTDFIFRIGSLQSANDYSALVDHYGIRRTDNRFWAFSDSLHDTHMQSRPVESGLLDFNRLENR